MIDKDPDRDIIQRVSKDVNAAEWGAIESMLELVILHKHKERAMHKYMRGVLQHIRGKQNWNICEQYEAMIKNIMLTHYENIDERLRYYLKNGCTDDRDGRFHIHSSGLD